MKDIVTAEDVQSVPPGGEVTAAPGAIVTPWAREMAASRGVRIVQGPARTDGQVVALGADHGGFALKEEVKTHLTRLGYRFHDVGTFSTEPVDYPDIALAVARAVRAGDARLGILVDGAGIGSAMAANKVPGVRAAASSPQGAARTPGTLLAAMAEPMPAPSTRMPSRASPARTARATASAISG